MATPQQKAFCILQFAKTNSVTTVQRLLRTFVCSLVTATRTECAEQPLHSCYGVGLRKLQDTESLLLWSHHFATRSPLAAAARNTFPRQLQTNFESFPNYWRISRDCRLTGYFIMNMWKCYLLFELPCAKQKHFNQSVIKGGQGDPTLARAKVKTPRHSAAWLWLACVTTWLRPPRARIQILRSKGSQHAALQHVLCGRRIFLFYCIILHDEKKNYHAS
jgi:hypothetical protein